MKKNLIRIITVLLMLAMTVLSFAACSDKGEAQTTTSQKPAATTPAESGGLQKDSIPEDTDLGDCTVSILHAEDRVAEFNPANPANSVESKIVSRNLTVQDRLNVTLNFIPTLGGYNGQGASPFKQTVFNDFLGGQGAYDICADYGMTIGSCAVDALCLDLTEFNVIDLDAPWWAPGLTEDAMVNGKLLFATGDISTNYLSSMYCMFFNENLVASREGMPNPYEMVEMDNWKWEFFIGMCTDFFTERDGVANASDNDSYALCISSIVTESMFYSVGNKFLEMDETRELILSPSISSNRASDFYDMTQTFLKSEDCFVNHDKAYVNFSDGYSAFAVKTMDYAAELVASNVEWKFGVLPMPKYDDNQDYSSACWVGRSLYFLSAGSKAAEGAAVVFECLASEGYRQVTGELYDETYKLRYSSGDECSQMIDIIRESIVFDLAQVFTYSFENQLPTRLTRSLIAGDLYMQDSKMHKVSTAMATYGTAMETAVANIANAYQ